MVFMSVVALCILLPGPVFTEDEKARADSSEVLADLYDTLKKLVFPSSVGKSNEVSGRFVLLMPGKILKYCDYFPGTEYEESLLHPSPSRKIPVPPCVMEKWFDLADVLVGPDIFDAGVTSTGFGKLYKTILTKIEDQGLTRKEALRNYNTALSYFSEIISDPENEKSNATRIELYNRYQKEYEVKKLEMEEQISDAMKRKTAMEYDQWFKINYPFLNAKVEGAYTKWLAFGQKDLIDLYKTYVDAGSVSSELEDARNILEASGTSSFDRARTIYPVSFEPGNWYHYLNNRGRTLTRDTTVSKKSMFESELTLLENIAGYDPQYSDESLALLQTLFADQTEDDVEPTIDTNVCTDDRRSQRNPRDRFSAQSASESDPCSKEDTFSMTSGLQNASLLFIANSSFISERTILLQSEVEALQEHLDNMNIEDTYLGGVADTKEFMDLNMVYETNETTDAAWTSFDFSSDYVYAGVGVNVILIARAVPNRGIHLDNKTIYGAQELQQAMNSAKVRVSGKVLKVIIKRDWFKPSIFEVSTLQFVDYDDNTQKYAFVSPGPSSENYISAAVGGNLSNKYLMVEYVSSFLLIKDLRLEFSGMKASSISRAMQLAADNAFVGSYNTFSLNNATSDRTATGLILTVPDAQVIGYYTNILPKFPEKQSP